MGRLFAAFARLVLRRPWLTIAAALALSAAAVPPLLRVSFDTDVTQLLPRDDPRIAAFLEAKDLVSEPGAVYALFEVEGGGGAEAPALAAYLEAWGEAASGAEDGAGRPLARSVEYRVPERYERFVRTILSRYGFLYLEGQALDGALARLDDAAIRAAVAANRARLESAAPVQLARALAEDPLGLNALFARHFARGLGAFRFDPLSGYLISRDGRAALATVIGERPTGDIGYARSLLGALGAAEAAGAKAAAPLLEAGTSIRAGYAGGYLVAIENARSIRRDIGLTFTTSFVLVTAIFVFAFRRLRALAYAALPLAAGMLWTFAALAIWHGEIGVATAAFASVVVGLAIDYSIHMTSRYVGQRRAGAAVGAAIETALASAGGGVIPAALMTIAVFLTFRLTSFGGLAELGTLAATGMAICLVSTFWLLPPLLALTGRRRRLPPVAGEGTSRAKRGDVMGASGLPPVAGEGTSRAKRGDVMGERDESRPMAGFGLARLWGLIERRPRAIVAASALVTAAAAVYLFAGPAPAIRFETELKNLVTRSERTAEVEEGLDRRFGLASEAGIALARGATEEDVLDSLDALSKTLERDVAEGAITGFESPSRILPPRAAQEAALARLARIDRARVAATLRAALAAEGFKVSAFEGSIERLLASLAPPGPVTRATLEAAGLGDLLGALKPPEGGRPATGMAVIFPARGSDALERLGPEMPAAVTLTGVRAVVRALVGALEHDFSLATAAAAAAVLAIAFAHFRRPGAALLAAIPAFTGFLWLLAVMKALGMPVNFLNVIVFPMVIGIEDNAVHIVHRVREKGSGGVRRTLDEIGLALFLCTATTLLGFGSLILSDNRGLASIGAVTIIGKMTGFLTGTVALPAALALGEARRARAR